MRNAFYSDFDTERFESFDSRGDYRTAFQIDRDRILHTPAFRRLQNKTQVFWSGEYDFYRTRLTHSLEVAQIGRSICGWLQHSSSELGDTCFIDPDLVEAVCLAHDLGHPPFGHAGERSLNHFMGERGGFEGNAQTLRLLTERIFSEKNRGMNPSRAFMDGVLKYKSLWSELKRIKGKAPKNHFLYDEQERYLDWVMDGLDFPPELPPGDDRDGLSAIECQIMDWADDTAYSLNDLADGVQAGFINGDRVAEWASHQSLSAAHTNSLDELVSAIRRGRMDGFVGSRIGRYIQACCLTNDVNLLSGSTRRYAYRLEIDADNKAECSLFKKLAFEVVFLSPQLKQLEHKGNVMLREVWEILSKRYVDDDGGRIDGQDFQLLPPKIALEIEGASSVEIRSRLVCDYLASLSDGAAARFYKRCFVPGYGSIGDLIN